MAKGIGHNSELIVFNDYNLLFKGEEQVEICFIAQHEWKALHSNERMTQIRSSEFVANNPWQEQKKHVQVWCNFNELTEEVSILGMQ